ncbi:MAG TPA: hypothetical protein VGI81_00450 [Tepidisphaeraceae bacterium]
MLATNDADVLAMREPAAVCDLDVMIVPVTMVAHLDAGRRRVNVAMHFGRRTGRFDTNRLARRRRMLDPRRFAPRWFATGGLDACRLGPRRLRAPGRADAATPAVGKG